MELNRSLVVFYSRSGQTKFLAQQISSLLHSDIQEIVLIKPYPENYSHTVKLVKEQMETGQKVDIEPIDINPNYYDVIFIGSPVWWHTFAPPIKMFLEKYNLNGKTIVPFCSHAGGGEANTFVDFAKLLPDSRILDGFSAYERNYSRSDISIWLDKVMSEV